VEKGERKYDVPRSHSLHEESFLSGSHLVSHRDGVSGGGRKGVSFLKGRGRKEERKRTRWESV